MNKRKSASCSRRKEKCLESKSLVSAEYTEITTFKETPSHLNSEQNESTIPQISPLSHKGRKAKGRKSIKRSPTKEADLQLSLSHLSVYENVTSPAQRKEISCKNQQVLNSDLGTFSSGKNKINYSSKSSNSVCNRSDNKFDTFLSPEKSTNGISLDSPNPRHLLSADCDFVSIKELVNNATDVAFSPTCSSANDLKNNISNIVDVLAEKRSENEKSARIPSYISPSKEESDAVKNILKGVIAYVEVRSGHENRTKAIELQLHRMGAKTVPKFLSTTTHVIFKDGKKSTRDKAVARNIPLVSALWVESCRQQRCYVPEADFPANIPEIYDSPFPYRRIRKLKSMQPKDFSAEYAGSIERLQKIFSRIRQDNDYSASFSDSKATTSKDDNTALYEDCSRTPLNRKMSAGRCRLFGASLDGSEIGHVKDKRNIEELNTSSNNPENNSDASGVSTKVTVKKRKLLSDLNHSPKIIAFTPNATRARVKCNSTPRTMKCNSTPRTKRPRSKLIVEKSVKSQTTVKDENVQIESNLSADDSIPACTGKRCHLKENSGNSLDDFEDKRCRKDRCYKKKRVTGDCSSWNDDNKPSLSKTVTKKSSIVLTSLQSTDREVIYSIIDSLGGFKIKHSVTDKTTHVVSGDSRRTLSVLFALVRGCWLLSSQWIYQSMEAGHWLEEEPYELKEYFPASQVSRLERAVRGQDYCQDLFSQFGNIFISAQCTPSFDSLAELVMLSGGKVSTCLRKCVMVIGPYTTQSRRESGADSNVLHLSEKWILDCISQHKTLPFDDYKI